MAGAGDRLQIVLAAKDEISAELKQVKSEMNSLGRTSVALQKRMADGEQGLQAEYEESRRELERNRLKQIELGRAASKAKSEIRQMTTDGTAGMKRLDRATDDVGRSMGKTRSATSTLAVGWGKMAGAVGIAAGAIASLSGAFRFLSSSIEEARQQRKATAQLAAVMKSMGRTESAEEIGRLVDQMVRMSALEDDEILSSINLLLTFGEVTGDTFKQAERASIDLAAAFHMDLQSATVMVGKALNNPIGGLTSLMRVGVAFTETQKEKIKSLMEEGELLKAQKIIMSELTKQVGGSAAAQMDGIDATRVAWKDFKQEIGETLMTLGDVIGQATGWDLAQGLRESTKWLKQNRDEIISVLAQIVSAVFKLISVFLKWQSIMLKVWGYLFGAMTTTLEVLGAFNLVSDDTIETVRSLADGFGTASQKANDASKKFNEMSESTHEASKEAKILADALKNIKGKNVRLVLRTVVQGFTRLDDIGAPVEDALAMGGPVNVGVPTLVGELGPELFVPTIGPTRVIGADGPEIRDFRTSGTVIPNHLLATVTLPKQQSATPAGYVGPPVQIGTINTSSSVDVEAAVLRATMRADRIARERR